MSKTPNQQQPPRSLPMTRREMQELGWEACDIILISGDAYVDHPSFGVALIARLLEASGYRVGVIAQPDTSTVESFRQLGCPRLFWGISAGNVDSQLAKWTVMRKIRRDDPYSPGGRAGLRPPNASIVYASMARHACKGIPVVLGGIEASLRRFPFYDYWTDKVRRSILFDAKADLIAFGMAEKAVVEIAGRIGGQQDTHCIAGTAEIRRDLDGISGIVELPPYEEISIPDDKGKAAFTAMTRTIQELHRPGSGKVLVQKHGDRWLVVHPPADPLSTAELDRIYSLPFTRRPHPSYGSARIPAYEMIKDSVTTHRGCYAECSFCAITAHQGKRVISRSSGNVLEEIGRIASDPAFHGTISDLGGPTANMYGTGCRAAPAACNRHNCLHPRICPNLQIDHRPLIALMRAAGRVRNVKHVFVTSGIRFDLAMAGGGSEYVRELVRNHVCGLLKIAPEHVSPDVLRIMQKSNPQAHLDFVDCFRHHVRAEHRRYALVEYFMSGHPGCTMKDMVLLAQYLHARGIRPEQVQDYYPAPMTLAASMFYTGTDPLTMKKVYVARSDREKSLQRALLLHHLPDFQKNARVALQEAGRADLIGFGKHCLVRPARTTR